jgi:PleD family two-component response regulator
MYNDYVVYFFHKDQQLIDVYRRVFENFGFRFRQASHRQACFMLLEEEVPHLIITSLIMDVSNGFVFLNELKKHCKENVPIIVYTNFSEREDIRKTKSIGASSYFIEHQTKPEFLMNEARRLLSLCDYATL